MCNYERVFLCKSCVFVFENVDQNVDQYFLSRKGESLINGWANMVYFSSVGTVLGSVQKP